jgi:hypothetical protein
MRNGQQNMPRRQRAADSRYKILLDRSSALAAGLGTALVVSPSDSRTDKQSAPAVEIEVGSAWRGTTPLDSPVLINRVYGPTTSGVQTIPVRDEEKEWSESEQKRFEELAVAEAVGELNDDDVLELEQLSQVRRSVQQPRSGDEVLWEFEQRRLTAELLETLSRYVEFYEGPDPAWSSAGKTSHRQ